jgi:hypothetical protein
MAVADSLAPTGPPATATASPMSVVSAIHRASRISGALLAALVGVWVGVSFADPPPTSSAPFGLLPWLGLASALVPIAVVQVHRSRVLIPAGIHGAGTLTAGICAAVAAPTAVAVAVAAVVAPAVAAGLAPVMVLIAATPFRFGPGPTADADRIAAAVVEPHLLRPLSAGRGPVMVVMISTPFAAAAALLPGLGGMAAVLSVDTAVVIWVIGAFGTLPIPAVAIGSVPPIPGRTPRFSLIFALALGQAIAGILAIGASWPGTGQVEPLAAVAACVATACGIALIRELIVAARRLHGLRRLAFSAAPVDVAGAPPQSGHARPGHPAG